MAEKIISRVRLLGKQTFITEFILPLIIITLLFLLVFSPALSAQFDWIDDHEVFRYTTPVLIHPIFRNIVGGVSRDLTSVIESELAVNRFRPAYRLVRGVEMDILGRNPQAWHLYRIMMGVSTMLFFYISMRILKIPRWISGVGIVLLTLQSTATEIWFRLGPSETQAMLFTALATCFLVIASRKIHLTFFDVFAIILLGLAGWSKESFILIMPPLILIRIVITIGLTPHLKFWHVLFRLTPVWLFSATLFFIQLYIILFRVGTEYAGLNRSVSAIDQWLAMFNQITQQHIHIILGVIGIILSLFAWYRFRRYPTKPLFIATYFIVLILWFIPQFILHSNTGISGSRYAYPILIGFVLLNIIPLIVAYRHFPRLTVFLSLPVVLLFIYQATIATYNVSLQFYVRTIALNKTISFFVQNANPDEYIVMNTHPILQFEKTISFVIFFGANEVNSPIALYIQDDNPDDSTGLVEIFFRHFPLAQPAELLESEQVDLIIHFAPEDIFLSNPPEWFDMSEYTRWEFFQQEPLLVEPGFATERFVVYQHNH